MLNPFSNDAFNMVALTAAINKIPNNYGRLEQLNL
ncbi:MAG: major capsid protein, partial [Acidobacteria bacterium]|nr:major capsid protein [Acidobacteriota bacterium]